MPLKLSSAVLLTPLLLLLGCRPSDDDVYTEDERPPVAFEGEADGRIVGKWKSVDGTQAYTFSTDGRFESETNVVNRGKPMSMKSDGEWKAKGTQVLFRDKAGIVVPYAYELKGDVLTLTTVGSMKNKIALQKK